MRILITGCAGFVGASLAEFCLGKKCEVHGLERPGSPGANAPAGVRMHEADIRDYAAVRGVLDRARPEWIFHLAAQSLVTRSWKSPADTFLTNVVGQANLFEAILELGIRPRFHVAGSSEEYGNVRPDELPITEETPLRPLSPYAVSKVAQDLMGYQYFESHRIEAVRTRAFNHTGPRRSDQFVVNNFASQIAKIESGLQEPVVRVGNLEAVRDFTDVRDVVRAYWLALERCDAGGVYNVSSGRGLRIGDALKFLLDRAHARVEVRVDPERLRPADLAAVVGSNEKFARKTGWRPEVPFERTMEELLESARRKTALKKEAR